MKGVACLAWQPFAASQLAVGCSSGVLLWTVDPASVVSRPSSSCVVRCSYVKYLTSILFSGWRDCKVQQRLFVGLPTENWWPPAHHPTQGFTFGVQPHRSLNHQHSLHFIHISGLCGCSQEGRRWCYPCQLESQCEMSLHCHPILSLQSVGNQSLIPMCDREVLNSL